MLTVTFCVLILLAAFCWRPWLRAVDKITMVAGCRRTLVAAYWLLVFSFSCDLAASFVLLLSSSPALQFKVLCALGLGMLPQVAMFAFVATPVAMREKSRKRSFRAALIIMEACAVGAIVMLLVGLVLLLREREKLLNNCISPGPARLVFEPTLLRSRDVPRSCCIYKHHHSGCGDYPALPAG